MGIFHCYFFFILFPTRMPFTLYRPLPHGANHLHTAPPPSRPWPPRLHVLAIRTLDIRYGGVFDLAQAIRAVERGGFDMMILTETKISTTAYCRKRLGYEVA